MQHTYPSIVSKAEWELKMAEVLEKEKELTKQADRLAAMRRRLPMHIVEKDYYFDTNQGKKSLMDLFDGRRQLIIYHFMFGPDWEKGCPGCSWVVDAMSHESHLNVVGVSLAIIGRAALDKLIEYKEKMGWNFNWASSLNSDFNFDFRGTVNDSENHGVSVFVRTENEIFQTYHIEDRGVEHLGSHWTYLDITPFGRKEEWEDSPEGWPQNRTYTTNQRHNEYMVDGRSF